MPMFKQMLFGSGDEHQSPNTDDNELTNEDILKNLLEEKETEIKDLRHRVQALMDAMHKDSPRGEGKTDGGATDFLTENVALREALAQAQQQLSEVVMGTSDRSAPGVDNSEAMKQVTYWKGKWEEKEQENVRLLSENTDFQAQIQSLQAENAQLRDSEQRAVAALEAAQAAAATAAVAVPDRAEVPTVTSAAAPSKKQDDNDVDGWGDIDDDEDLLAAAATESDINKKHFQAALGKEPKNAADIRSEEIEKLTAQLDIRSAEAEELRIAASNFLEQKRDYESTISDLQRKLQGDGAQKQEIANLQSNVELLELENGNLNKENTELRKEVKRLESEQKEVGGRVVAAAATTTAATVNVVPPAHQPPVPRKDLYVAKTAIELDQFSMEELREEFEEVQEILEIEQGATDKLRAEIADLQNRLVVLAAAPSTTAATSSSSPSKSSNISGGGNTSNNASGLSFAQEMEMQKLKSDLTEEKKKNTELIRQLNLLEEEVEKRAQEVRSLSKSNPPSPSHATGGVANGATSSTDQVSTTGAGANAKQPRVSEDGWGDDAWGDDDDEDAWGDDNVDVAPVVAGAGSSSGAKPAATVPAAHDQEPAAAIQNPNDLPVTSSMQQASDGDGWGDDDDAFPFEDEDKTAKAVLETFNIASPEEGNTPLGSATGADVGKMLAGMVKVEELQVVQLDLEEQRRLVSHLNIELEKAMQEVRKQEQSQQAATTSLARVEQLEIELKDKIFNFDRLEKENSALVEQNTSMTQNMDALALKFEELQRENESLTQEKLAMNQQSIPMETSQISEASSVQDLTQEKDKLMDTLTRITTELAEKENVIAKQESDGKLAEEALALKTAEVDKLKSEQDASKQAFDLELDALRETNGLLETRIEQLRQDLEKEHKQAQEVISVAAVNANASSTTGGTVNAVEVPVEVEPVKNMAGADAKDPWADVEDDDGWDFGDDSPKEQAPKKTLEGSVPTAAAVVQPPDQTEEVESLSQASASAALLQQNHDKLAKQVDELVAEKTELLAQQATLSSQLEQLKDERGEIFQEKERITEENIEFNNKLSTLEMTVREQQEKLRLLQEEKSSSLQAGPPPAAAASPETSTSTTSAPPAPEPKSATVPEPALEVDDDGWDFDDESPAKTGSAGGELLPQEGAPAVPVAPAVATTSSASSKVPQDPLSVSVESRQPSKIRLSEDSTLDWNEKAPTPAKLEAKLRETEMRYEELRGKFSDCEKEFLESSSQKDKLLAEKTEEVLEKEQELRKLEKLLLEQKEEQVASERANQAKASEERAAAVAENCAELEKRFASEKDKLLDEKNLEISAKIEEAKVLNSLLQEKEEQLAVLASKQDANAAEQQTALAASTAELGAKTEEAKELAALLKEKEEALALAQMQVADAATANGASLAEKDAEIAEKDSEIAEKIETMKQLSEQLQTLGEELTTAKKQVEAFAAEKQSASAEKDEELTQRIEEAKQLSQLLQEKEEELAMASMQADDSEAVRENLREKEQELAKKTEEASELSVLLAAKSEELEKQSEAAAAKLQEAVLAKSETIAKLEEDAKQSAALVEQKQEELEAVRAQLEQQKNGASTEQQALVVEKEAEIAERKEEAKHLSALLQEKEKEVLKLQQDKASSAEQHEAVLLQKDEEIQTKTEEAKYLSTQLQELESEKERALADLKQDLSDKEQTIHLLSSELEVSRRTAATLVLEQELPPEVDPQNTTTAPISIPAPAAHETSAPAPAPNDIESELFQDDDIFVDEGTTAAAAPAVPSATSTTTLFTPVAPPPKTSSANQDIAAAQRTLVAEEELQALQEKSEKQKNELEKLNSELSFLQQQLDPLTQQNASLTEQNASLSEENANLTEKNAILSKDLEKQSSEIEDLKQAKSNILIDNDVFVRETATKEAKFLELLRDKEENESSMLQQIQQLTERNTGKEQEIAEIMLRQNELETKVKEIEAELGKTEEEKESLRMRMEEAESERANLALAAVVQQEPSSNARPSAETEAARTSAVVEKAEPSSALEKQAGEEDPWADDDGMWGDDDQNAGATTEVLLTAAPPAPPAASDTSVPEGQDGEVHARQEVPTTSSDDRRLAEQEQTIQNLGRWCLSDQEKTILEMRKEIETKEQNAEKTLSEMDNVKEELELKIAGLDTEVSDLKQQLQLAEEAKLAAEEQLSSALLVARQKSENEQQEHEENLEKDRAVSKQLEVDMEKLCQEKTELEQSFKQQINDLEDQIAELQTRHLTEQMEWKGKLQEEKEAAVSQAEKAALDRFQGEASVKDKELSSLREINAERDEQIVSLEKHLQTAMEKLENASETMEGKTFELRQQLESAEQVKSQLEQDLARAKEEQQKFILAKNEEFAARERELQENSDLQTLQNAKQALQLQLDAATTRSQEFAEKCQMELGSYREKLLFLEKEKQDLSDKVLRLNKNLLEVNSENDALVADMEEKEEKLMQYEMQQPMPQQQFHAAANGHHHYGNTMLHHTRPQKQSIRIHHLQEENSLLKHDVESWKEREQTACAKIEEIIADGERLWYEWEQEKQVLVAENLETQKNAKLYIKQSREAYLRLKKEGSEYCAGLEKQLALLQQKVDSKGNPVTRDPLDTARTDGFNNGASPVSHIHETNSPQGSGTRAGSFAEIANFLENDVGPPPIGSSKESNTAKEQIRLLDLEVQKYKEKCALLEQQLSEVGRRIASSDKKSFSGSPDLVGVDLQMPTSAEKQAGMNNVKRASQMTKIVDALGESVRTTNLHGTPQVGVNNDSPELLPQHPMGTPLIKEDEEGWDWEDDDVDPLGGNKTSTTGAEQEQKKNAPPEANTNINKPAAEAASKHLFAGPNPSATPTEQETVIKNLQKERSELQSELQQTVDEKLQLEQLVTSLQNEKSELQLLTQKDKIQLSAAVSGTMRKFSNSLMPSITEDEIDQTQDVQVLQQEVKRLNAKLHFLANAASQQLTDRGDQESDIAELEAQRNLEIADDQLVPPSGSAASGAGGDMMNRSLSANLLNGEGGIGHMSPGKKGAMSAVSVSSADSMAVCHQANTVLDSEFGGNLSDIVLNKSGTTSLHGGNNENKGGGGGDNTTSHKGAFATAVSKLSPRSEQLIANKGGASSASRRRDLDVQSDMDNIISAARSRTGSRKANSKNGNGLQLDVEDPNDTSGINNLPENDVDNMNEMNVSEADCDADSVAIGTVSSASRPRLVPSSCDVPPAGLLGNGAGSSAVPGTEGERDDGEQDDLEQLLQQELSNEMNLNLNPEQAQLQRQQMVEQMLLHGINGPQMNDSTAINAKQDFDASALRAFVGTKNAAGGKGGHQGPSEAVVAGIGKGAGRIQLQSGNPRERTMTEMSVNGNYTVEDDDAMFNATNKAGSSASMNQASLLLAEMEEQFSTERTELQLKIDKAEAKVESLTKELELLNDKLLSDKHKFEEQIAEYEASSTASQIELTKIKQELELEKKRNSTTEMNKVLPSTAGATSGDNMKVVQQLQQTLAKVTTEKQQIQKQFQAKQISLQNDVKKLEQELGKNYEGKEGDRMQKMITTLRQERDKARELAEQFHKQLQKLTGVKPTSGAGGVATGKK
ncbi:unnamed protein product [Amoebophrya sp. A120]|nr:unnamed protein product [Amoebophrya sp. A120]|eukprot:GSA120T00012363001.1